MLTLLMHSCGGKQGIQPRNNGNERVSENFNESDILQGLMWGGAKLTSGISLLKL